MLHVVIKVSDTTTDESLKATVDSVSQNVNNKKLISVLQWHPNTAREASVAALAKLLTVNGASLGDYIVIVRPGTLVSKELLDEAVSRKWSARNSRVRVVDYEEEPYWNGTTPVLVKMELLQRVDFTITKFDQDERSRFFLELLRLEGWYDTINARMRLPQDDRIERMGHDAPELYTKAWYMDFNRVWSRLLSTYGYGAVPRVGQLAYIYMLQYRLTYNANSFNKYVLQGKDLTDFYRSVAENLNYIEDEILMSAPSSYIKLDRNVRLFLLELKNSKLKTRYEYQEQDVLQYIGDTFVQSAASANVIIESMEHYEGELSVSGHVQFIFDPRKVNLVCRCDGEEYRLKDTKRFTTYSLFGQDIFRYPTFTVKIPDSVVKSARTLSFHLVSRDAVSDVKMKQTFPRPMAKLNGNEYSYWANIKLGKIIKYRHKVLWLTRYSVIRAIYHELRYLYSMLFLNANKVTRRAAFLRVMYWTTRPLYRRPIWIFYDKLYKGGDNGEYAYDYARQVSDGVKKHYVLSAKSTDAKRFKAGSKPFLPYGTLRHRLAFLNADIVFATHSTQSAQNSLQLEGIYTRDLFNYHTMFLQHGLTIQSLPKILGKYVDNTKKYFVASHFETENLLLPDYGYTKSEIKTTGVARYDGLVSKPKKQILITPTWRNYLAKPMSEARDSTREKNGEFVNSNYFKLYNNLINDKKLLDVAEQTGYQVVYLLHPVTSSQIDDFKGHDKRAKVIASTGDTSYEEILTESDLMVTDYSGVQFDFAYMKKPILYYHPNELPPTYDEAIYTYARDSLGEIVKRHDQLVDKLCEYMENGCQVPKKYADRMEKFFYNHDHNNAARIYEESIKFQRSLDK